MVRFRIKKEYRNIIFPDPSGAGLGRQVPLNPGTQMLTMVLGPCPQPTSASLSPSSMAPVFVFRKQCFLFLSSSGTFGALGV